jgi:hypothetical protein
LIGKISQLSRYIVCSRITKRPIFLFVSSKFRPGDALSCFALEDDYSFGILQSTVHWMWFVEKCSKMKSDFRYTPESVFDTFPWPQSPSPKAIAAVVAASRDLMAIRSSCERSVTGGLRGLYRTLDLPGGNPLRDAHLALNAAALAAYGFSARDDILEQLLELNLELAAKSERGTPAQGPGLPRGIRSPEKYVSKTCLSPC